MLDTIKDMIYLVSRQPSAVSRQPSAVSRQPSAVSRQPSAVSPVPAQQAPQSDFGCEAVLCFAGGMHEPACQKTIRKVIKRLARGKSFPICHGYNSNITAKLGRVVVKPIFENPHQNNFGFGGKCPDGKTTAFRHSGGKSGDPYWTCRTVKIKVPKSIASDSAHQKQTYYW